MSLAALGELTAALIATVPMLLGSLLQLWMHTTACLGIRFGINPYDQPGVERSKQVTDRLLRDGQ